MEWGVRPVQWVVGLLLLHHIAVVECILSISLQTNTSISIVSNDIVNTAFTPITALTTPYLLDNFTDVWPLLVQPNTTNGSVSYLFTVSSASPNVVTNVQFPINFASTGFFADDTPRVSLSLCFCMCCLQCALFGLFLFANLICFDVIISVSNVSQDLNLSITCNDAGSSLLQVVVLVSSFDRSGALNAGPLLYSFAAVKTCPLNTLCPLNCSGHGICSLTAVNSVCICEPQYAALPDCSLGFWADKTHVCINEPFTIYWDTNTSTPLYTATNNDWISIVSCCSSLLLPLFCFGR